MSDYKNFGRLTANAGSGRTRLSVANHDRERSVTVCASEGNFMMQVSLSAAEARHLAQMLLAGVDYCESLVQQPEVVEVQP